MADEFETAVEAVLDGDVAALQSMLQRTPALARMRSARPHGATLLHYLAANGVEEERQRTPKNALDVARMLLDAGAEVDAVAEFYGDRHTTLGLLVSSAPPAEAGVQAPLAELLLDYGAAPQSAALTALTFGFAETAKVLVRRGAPVSLEVAAGLGRLDDVTRLLPDAEPRSRHVAFALAAQHGRVEIVKLLLDAGEDPNRYNPEGHHPHSTPLHQAVWSGHLEVVRLLIDRGARLDLRDTVHSATPLEWAVYRGDASMTGYLRQQSGA